MDDTLLAPPLRQVDRTCVRFAGARLAYFGGCDYFRLSSEPRILKALRDGLKKCGLTVAASRSTTGNHQLYERLESRLARFFGAPRAVLLSNGYLTNLAVAQALAGTFSHALLDERAHSSLVDAARFLDCPVMRFKHRDPRDASRMLRNVSKPGRSILLTDGLFSHDGSIAPLDQYIRLLPADAVVLVDDAHGAGVLGKTGRGTSEQTGVSRQRIVQTIALSKAFGTYGGAVLCSPELADIIQVKSRLFNGNTPLPLPLASAGLKAIEILDSGQGLRARLARNTLRVKTALGKMGYPVAETPAPIVSLIPARSAAVSALKKQFIAHGIFPSFIKYPGGPDEGYFRFAISSEHSQAQLESLISAFRSVWANVREVAPSA